MRISTAALHNAAILQITDRTAALVKTQNQLASGKRIVTPADDPTGAVQALGLDRALAQSQQYGRNADAAKSRLSFEEQALADTTTLLDRVRVLALQANSGALDSVGRQSIATELQTRLGELVDIANRRDGNGEYLFSGYATLTQPFALSGGGATYSGDQGVRLLQTSDNQKIADGHPGSTVFMDIPQGNGTFVTGVGAANTGSGIIDAGSVTDRSAWVPDTYTISFTSETTYDVLDSSSNVVASGTYAPDGAIAFNGIQVQLSGAPAAGDTFTVTPSGKQDIFTTISNLITTLGRPADTDADNARFVTEIGTALAQLDRTQEHISTVRAEVGGRLSVLDSAADTRADRELDLQTALGSLRDLDYADAIARLNMQLTGLQAAQQSYTKISQLSLFNYI